MEQVRLGAYKAKSSNEITIFPMHKKEMGAHTMINLPIILKYPYALEDLGDAVIRCIEIVTSSSYSDMDFGTLVIDTKRRRDMTKLYLHQLIFHNINNNFIFYPTVGERDGSFSFMGLENGIQIGCAVPKAELGNTLLETFSKCK